MFLFRLFPSLSIYGIFFMRLKNRRVEHQQAVYRRIQPAMHACFIAMLAVMCATFAAISIARAQPVDVLPVRISEGAQSLNGTWMFKYIPALDAGGDEGFYQVSFDVRPASRWSTIDVPSHWELQGFAEPQYADDVKEGTGLYRRTFSVPQDWRQQNQRVFLRFDGVLYGFRAWVNGKQVGEWNSSYNQATFDITDALKSDGADNLLAVRVTTRSKGWNFDNMDCWGLSGIYRDVTVFALPQAHLKDYTAVTTLKQDGSAELRIDVLASSTATNITAHLIDPERNPAGTSTIPVSRDGKGSAIFTIAKPKLWTAETPFLYRLELDVNASGTITQRYTDRVGLRQVTIEDGILKLNGTPIKLRGINHHDIWPEGRVATEENMHRDLDLMRAANINFIRTSHYPPHPRFIELCDEMGFYVDDEVPYVHGRKNLTNADYQDTLYMRARATIMRDKNRPSVIFWSLGNENPVTELGLNTGRYAKKLDPSRPITFPTIGSYFAKNWEKYPEFVDLYAPHYPPLATAVKYAETLKRPIVFTEYAHQRGLARGGTSMQDLWDVFYKSPRVAGGAIWMFQDQGIARTAPGGLSAVEDSDLMVWLDEHRYYDTRGFYAMDGIVYSDRTPQEDYWQVRKVYSPVQIKERVLAVKPGAQTLALHVENRHDFRSLTGMKLRWTLHRNRTPIQSGVATLNAMSKQTEIVSIPVNLPATLSSDIYVLSLQCINENNLAIHERTIRLETGASENARWSALASTLPQAQPALELTDTLITVRCASYQLKLDRKNGRLSLHDVKGETIVSDFGPHTGRNPTINDMGKNRERLPSLWQGSLLRNPNDLRTSARKTDDGGVEITVSGNYARPGVTGESVHGTHTLLIASTGAIKVTYDYAPVNATGEMLEAGFALSLPKKHSELRWLGQGPYAGYPGKDRLNEYNCFHLNREDLYFHGNRREVEFVALSRHDGTGVLLNGTSMTIDLEKIGDETILSHLCAVPGVKAGHESRGENVEISSRLKASSLKRIAGEFTLLPLNAQWSEPLASWLGQPSECATVTPGYFHSYDQ